jgi:hypothetical protein
VGSGLRTDSSSKASAAIVLIAIIAFTVYFCPSTQAETQTNFTPSDQFPIPATNSVINFAVNGSYSSAELQGNVWVFTNLILNGSVPLATLKVSTENSNMTILYYHIRIGTSTVIPNESLRYIIVGEGKVTVNLGYSNMGQYSGSDWYFSKEAGDGNHRYFFTLGPDYNLGKDGTFTVYKTTGNISITHIKLSSFAGNNANLPFIQQHSVIIASAIVLILTVTVTVIITLKNKPDKGALKRNGRDA